MYLSGGHGPDWYTRNRSGTWDNRYREKEETNCLRRSMHGTKALFSRPALCPLTSATVQTSKAEGTLINLSIQVFISCLSMSEEALTGDNTLVACPFPWLGEGQRGHSPIDQVYLLVDQAWQGDSLANMSVL